MKKVITILITLALALSLSASALAEPDTQSPIEPAWLVENVVSAGFPNTYKIEELGRLIVVKVWVPNLAQDILSAKMGNQDVKAAWDTLAKNLASLQQTLQELIDKNSAETCFVMFEVVDEITHDNLYLLICEGEILYNDVSK